MAFSCADCHKPHTKLVWGFSDCLGCHPEVTQDRGQFEQKALTDCVRCHSRHDWKAAGWPEAE